MDIQVKPNKDEGQDFKEFTLSMKEITWKIRCEINDEMIKKTADGTIPPFSWWGSIVLKYTDLKEEELHKYSTDEIIGIAKTIFEVANKKK